MRRREIRKTRRALGLSQSQMARLLGVHTMTISKWERGVLSPSDYQTDLLRLFARAVQKRPNLANTITKAVVGAGAAYLLFRLLESAFEGEE